MTKTITLITKDASIVGIDTINHHSRYKKSLQIDFQKTNTSFRKNILFWVKKHIMKPSQRNLLLPTPIMLLLSVSTETSNPNLTNL